LVSYLFANCELAELSSIWQTTYIASQFAQTGKLRLVPTSEKGDFMRIRTPGSALDKGFRLAQLW